MEKFQVLVLLILSKQVWLFVTCVGMHITLLIGTRLNTLSFYVKIKTVL